MDSEQSDQGPHCFVCMLKLDLDVSIYMQQTTTADDIFRCIHASECLRAFVFNVPPLAVSKSDSTD